MTIETTTAPADAGACRFDTELHSPTTGQRICAGTGTMPACALCPDSPDYWCENYAPQTEEVVLAEPKPLDWGRLLTIEDGWSKTGDPRPCSICGKDAIMRSPTNVPTHRTCAEAQAAR